MWRDHIDPGTARRRAAHRRRRARLPVVDAGATSSCCRSTCSTRGRPPSSATGTNASAPACRAETRYDDELPRDYWDAARVPSSSPTMGVDEAVVFPNFGLAVGAHARRRPLRAHREHDRVEPLVRVSRHRRHGPACTRSRTSRCATRPGCSPSSRASSATACGSRWSRPRSSTVDRSRIPITTRSGARSSTTV